ncbi:hypothetical protein [Bombiscardovia coagulans]|uniref:Uncharacterized protein n=1 Tax=Bombiscardovia coagulans TaxID=686666 RepID=A0A261ESP6_9BIFI|nr:hypothetical protein [Bombiscardovia coagulans]OZG49890.1 hypothetical protein BOCO_0407 [Bombiscardovia coagulans]
MSTKKPDRLLWIDIETGGLDPNESPLLEVELRVTDRMAATEFERIHRLVSITEDSHITLDQEAEKMHRENGLICDLKEQGIDYTRLYSDLSAFTIQASKHAHLIPAGSSPHFDLEWMDKQYPGALFGISHQHVDVSSIHIFLDTINPKLMNSIRKHVPSTNHRTSQCLDRDIAQYKLMLGTLTNMISDTTASAHTCVSIYSMTGEAFSDNQRTLLSMPMKPWEVKSNA